MKIKRMEIFWAGWTYSNFKKSWQFSNCHFNIQWWCLLTFRRILVQSTTPNTLKQFLIPLWAIISPKKTSQLSANILCRFTWRRNIQSMPVCHAMLNGALWSVSLSVWLMFFFFYGVLSHQLWTTGCVKSSRTQKKWNNFYTRKGIYTNFSTLLDYPIV